MGLWDHLTLAEGYEAHLKRLKAVVDEVPVPGLMGTRLRYDILGERYAYPRPEGMRVRNTFIVKPGREIPLRVYWPDVDGRPPVILYAHGGGFVAGSHDSHDMIIAQLAQATGAVVVSVHYRRTPENPYPAMHEDCYEALEWTASNGELLGWDASRLSVAGDSAGGLLSTALCIMSKRRNGPRIRHQALIYGVYDFDLERPYYRTAKDTTLTLDAIRNLAPAYLAAHPEAIADPVATPLSAKREDLEGLPPAYMLNGEYDILLEEELEYAELLRAAGVDVKVDVVPGTMHGLLRAIDICPPARAAFDRMCADIATHLRQP